MAKVLNTDSRSETELDDFLAENSGRPVVAVQGMGFVGSVMAFVCANGLSEDYAVIGVDLPNEQGRKRVDAINNGNLHINSSDPKVAQYYEAAREKGNLIATTDPSAFSFADVIIVDVNLDVIKVSNNAGHLENFDVDLEPFRRAIASIGNSCREDALVIVETTVPPGTCQKVVYPMLQELLKARGCSSERIRLGHSYERVMPGPNYVDSIQNFYRVYSGIDEKSAKATEAFLRTIIRTDEYPLTRLSNTNATEMAKVLENSYRSMNIAFMVEWSRFAEEANVDLYSVVDAIRMRDTHKNMMLPGLGVGGYCLTKDPLLASWAKQSLFDSADGLAQSEQGVRINDQMPHFALNFLRTQYSKKPLSESRVLLLGAAYRGDVDDTRYSPVEPLFRALSRDCAEVFVHDFFVKHWQDCDEPVQTDLNAAFKESFDIAILCTGHTGYLKENILVDSIANYKSPIFFLDTIGLVPDDQLKDLRKRHTVRVVGRGDIE